MQTVHGSTADSMPLLNIAKFSCVHFMVEGRLAIPNGPSFFSELVGTRITPKNPYLCEEFYNVSNSYHQVKALVERVSRGYDLTIHFDSTPGEEGEPSEEQKPSELLEALSGLGIESTFSYDIVFEYDKDASARFFPLKLPILSGATIDEFRGFKGVKYRAGEKVYQLSIESPDLEELYLNIEFGYRDRLNMASLERRLQEAATIANRTVFAEG